jgi:hypothetical protein
MWKIDPNTNTLSLSHTHTHTHKHTDSMLHSMFPKVELLKKTKGGGKEEENDSK